jgi:hypothetical protein
LFIFEKAGRLVFGELPGSCRGIVIAHRFGNRT